MPSVWTLSISQIRWSITHALLNQIQQWLKPMIENSELAELAAFAAVATHRSFRKAAIERGTSASAVSHAIRNLEARVGVRLLHRTTRNVSLTDAGQMLFAKLSPALSDIRVAVDDLNSW